MRLLTVTNLSKSFGTNELFSDVSFQADKGDRIGLVGTNGAGKTTLFKCLTKELAPDDGTVTFANAVSVGYVKQQTAASANTNDTLREEFLTAFADIIDLAAQKKALEKVLATNTSTAATADTLARYEQITARFENSGGYDYESRMRRISFGLGFNDADLNKNAAHFSGGQRTRILLAKALMREPDILLLDEPTNHLDIKMIEWLENFLMNYRGGVIVISHDRRFLDKVTNKTLELSGGKIIAYAGNYSRFVELRTELQLSLAKAYEKQQEYIRRTEEYIARYKAGIKAKQARGRESKLNRMERIILPPPDDVFDCFLLNRPTECAERVLETEHLSMILPNGHKLFDDVNLLIKKGDGVALIGANGTK